MGLDNVVADVRHDGETKAQEIVAAAKKEAEGILAAAKEKAHAREKARMQDAERDSEQVQLQARSRASSESRKIVLQAEASLREELRQSVVDGLSNTPEKTRAGHIATLVKRAQAIVPEGKVFGNAADQKALEGVADYAFGGTVDIIGGIIVESSDGATRLDLSYETLLQDMWRDVLRQEAKLFA